MLSFAKKIKRELSINSQRQKVCCSYSLLYGLLFSSVIDNEYATLGCLNKDVARLFIDLCDQLGVKKSFFYSYEKNKLKISSNFVRFFDYNSIKSKIFKCARCKESFFKGIFLAYGTVNDPEKSYRLELLFSDEVKAEQIKNGLLEKGIEALCAYRNKKHVLYLKRSEAIEDFFANIGATSIAFDIMNSKINKELINNANRVTNCDSANINKAIKAANKYNSVILELIESEKINLLPENLKEMAIKRIENKELSFSELGKLFNPAISKSGVYHRLEKILEFYNEIKN